MERKCPCNPEPCPSVLLGGLFLSDYDKRYLCPSPAGRHRRTELYTISSGVTDPLPLTLEGPFKNPWCYCSMLPFYGVETEAQTGRRVCSRPQSKSVAELQRLKDKKPDLCPASALREERGQRPPARLARRRAARWGGAYPSPASAAGFGGGASLQPAPLQHGSASMQHLCGGAAAAGGPGLGPPGRCGCGCGAVRTGLGLGRSGAPGGCKSESQGLGLGDGQRLGLAV